MDRSWSEEEAMSEIRQGMVSERDFAAHEHRDLMPGIHRIHETGCLVGHVTVGDLAVAVHRVVSWADHELAEHAAWEEKWLYPELDRRAESCWATRMLRFEHQQIRDLVRRIDAEEVLLAHELSRDDANKLRSDLFGLESLLRAHMEREEKVIAPVLEGEA
jgi:hemerythrin-like domain-containing protein